MTSKERYIQQLTQDLYCRNTDTHDECNDMAEIIVDEVYGKIKQALIGLADKLKTDFKVKPTTEWYLDEQKIEITFGELDNLIKEFLKNE